MAKKDALLTDAQRKRVAKIREMLAADEPIYADITKLKVGVSRPSVRVADLEDEDLGLGLEHELARRQRERADLEARWSAGVEGEVIPHIKSQDVLWAEVGGVTVGACWGCGETKPASGLVPMPRSGSNERSREIIKSVPIERRSEAWVCSDCIPEAFGRVEVGRDAGGVRVPGTPVWDLPVKQRVPRHLGLRLRFAISEANRRLTPREPKVKKATRRSEWKGLDALLATAKVDNKE
jgi:hypothetical protein